ncbi:hypothetical protein ACQPVP_03300 [Clostridium nigeriense]|uniref:hypothetical protein n=1 Tax=Clostridium nigeriense TaxID=1805470 RepID=UPI003D34698F
MECGINPSPKSNKPGFKISDFDYIPLDLLPGQIILKANRPITDEYYRGLRKLFLDQGIRIIIIPSDLDIIAIDNKLLIQNEKK